MVDLVVEDGTGLANANSWTTMAESDAYHASVGNAAWVVASPDTARIVAKIRGTNYIARKYAGLWPGTARRGRLQALPWPREDAIDNAYNEIAINEIPVEIKQAQFEAEWREFQNPGSLQPDVVANERIIREKVDVIETQYADVFGVEGSIPVITVIDDILAPLLTAKPGSKSNTSFLLRA